MAIRRGGIPADSFTIISNAWLRDPDLGLKEKGLAAYISSHAPDYVLTMEQILAENTDGKDSVRAGMLRLEERGYLVREQVRGEGGRISRTDYVLRDPVNGGLSSAGKSAPGADQAKEGVSAGGDQSGFSGSGKPAGKKTTPTGVKKTTEKTTSASPRGTRLPDDWRPSEVLVGWLLTKLPEGRWSDHSRRWAVHETEKFTHYWVGKTGRDATKLDWSRTWQKWMLTALERYRPVATGQAPGAAAGQFKTSVEKQMDKAERDTVRGKLVDELIDQGMPVGKAFEAVEAELKRREAAGEVIRLDTCTVPGYIDGNVIDASKTTVREVTA